MRVRRKWDEQEEGREQEPGLVRKSKMFFKTKITLKHLRIQRL